MNLYIHFPYCLYKCHYCDFNSHATPLTAIPSDDYVSTLIEELKKRKDDFESSGRNGFPVGASLETIFIGGGTPSLLAPSQLERLLDEIGRFFKISRVTEITLEANPKTIDHEKLRGFKNSGINRISVGVQSVNDRFLKPFGRIHSADDALEALSLVDQTGFSSWNADLIFGFPGQTLAEWKGELARLVALNPPHLSCYALTVEEETLYSHHVAMGKSARPDDDLQAAMLEETFFLLGATGYSSYEISNHARPGHSSRHNLNYWRYGSYLGIGAGAVSFFHTGACGAPGMFGFRTTNLKDPKQYRNAVRGVKFPFFETEEISRKTAMGEFMMMGLRLKEGPDPSTFHRLFGSTLPATFSETLAGHRSQGLIAPGNFSLTGRGRMLANQVMADYF